MVTDQRSSPGVEPPSQSKQTMTGARGDDPTVRLAHLHQPIPGDPLLRQIGRFEPLAGERFDRVAPELRDRHGSRINRYRPRPIRRQPLPGSPSAPAWMRAGTAPECGDPESGNLPGRPAVHWDIGRGGLRPIRTRGVTMMAFRTGRRMLVLGSIVTILAAGAVAGGLSFKRFRAHR